MGRGIASIYGALIILFLFSTVLAAMYVTTQMHSSLIRTEAVYAASSLRKEAELVKAVYSTAPSGLNISIRNLGSGDTSIEYIVAVSNGSPVYIEKLGGIVGGGSSSSFIVDIPVQFEKLYLVTGWGNFIPVLVDEASEPYTSDLAISGNSIQVNDFLPTYQYFPPYTLLVGSGGKWYQIYMENLSLIHVGAKLLYSLDKNISYFLEEELLFINNKFIDMIRGVPLGIGRNYIVINETRVITIYFSNTSKLVFDEADYIGFYGGGFWFYTSTIKLANGSFLNELYLIDDNGVKRIYLKYFFGLSSPLIRYPRLIGDTLYTIFNDGELIYTVSFSRTGVVNGSPIYSPTYIGSVGRWFTKSVIRNRWGVFGDLSLGYDNNLGIFDVYARGTYFRGLPSSLVGPIAIYVWQNESALPVDIGWSGSLSYRGNGDELGIGDVLWVKYMVFNRKTFQEPYDEWFSIIISLSSSLAKYVINITVDGVHGSDQYSIYPVGWIIIYNITEIPSSYFEETFSYTYTLNYTRSYSQYPYYTWYREMIGLRRASDREVELLFINEWGDFDVRRNNSISLDMPILSQAYQLEIKLYSHINYSKYIPILDWPREQVVAGLYIHNILFSGGSNGVNYIGPLKPRYSSANYIHYTNYEHSFDLVVLDRISFSRHYWLGLNNSLIVVDPLDYPNILDNNYLQLVGFKWLNYPPSTGFVEGYPGVYKIVGDNITRIDWVTSVVDDLAYELVLCGDYLLVVHSGGGLTIYVYKCWEVVG